MIGKVTDKIPRNNSGVTPLFLAALNGHFFTSESIYSAKTECWPIWPSSDIKAK